MSDNWNGSVRVRRSYQGYVDEYAELHLLPSATKEVVEAVYRVLARQRHPDQGGSDEAMQRLNDAYQKIMEHFNG